MKFIALLFFALTSFPSFAADLTVKVKGLGSTRGNISFSVFNQERGFPGDGERAYRTYTQKISAPDMTISLGDLPPGEYAIAFIHDEDEDQKLGTNFIGIPREGFGFSNNPLIVMGAPSYGGCAIDHLATGTEVEMEAKYF